MLTNYAKDDQCGKHAEPGQIQSHQWKKSAQIGELWSGQDSRVAGVGERFCRASRLKFRRGQRIPEQTSRPTRRTPIGEILASSARVGLQLSSYSIDHH
jgi:hypothetical protein